MRMTGGFHRTRHGIEARLSRSEAAMLRGLSTQLLELLDVGGQPTPADPLEALVGIAPGTVDRPADPVLARLLPDAYRDDDEAANDFRRYTEPGLRATKRAALRSVLARLGADGGRIVLDDESAQNWLAALNDLRLALGTRLEVTEDVYDEIAHMRRDDPRLPQLAVYEWLGMLEETLVTALARW